MADPAHPITPGQVLRKLRDGNARWVAGRAVHPHQGAARRAEVAARQFPLATVFGCIDSRVPPELVFDVGLGDLFVIRTAGQTNDDLVEAAADFGSEEARTPLVVVLGHQRCGAVTTAVRTLNSGATAPGRLQKIVDALTPAYHAAKDLPGDQIDNTVRAQVRLTVDQLRSDPLMAADLGDAEVVGAYYSLDTGAVDFTVA
ncbi:carbonic anhydrase [Kitasatospora sp. NPDC054939]